MVPPLQEDVRKELAASLLWALLVLFILRVLGQALVAFADVRFLPPMEAWYSGLMPYEYLLPSQIAIIGVMGVLIGFINVQAIAWLQSRIPDDLRGRVMSLVTLGSVGLAPVSLAIAGALVDLGAVTLTFLAAGAIVIAAAFAGIAWGVPATMVWPEEETA